MESGGACNGSQYRHAGPGCNPQAAPFQGTHAFLAATRQVVFRKPFELGFLALVQIGTCPHGKQNALGFSALLFLFKRLLPAHIGGAFDLVFGSRFFTVFIRQLRLRFAFLGRTFGLVGFARIFDCVRAQATYSGSANRVVQ